MLKNRFLVYGIFAIIAALLAACGGGPTGGPAAGGPESSGDSGSDSTVADGESGLSEELSVYNWADYIDEQVLADYEEAFGVRIIYDTYASNEDLLAKLQTGATGYDVIFPSDYMVAEMIDLGLLAEIDTAQLANVGNLDAQFMDAPFDPGNQHCVPYFWGTTGIAYRAGDAYFEENPPTSWATIFDPELLANYEGGGINVLNDARELPAAAAFYLGLDPNTTDPDELMQIQDAILAAKPFWKTFNSEDYPSSLLIPDEVVVSHAWSGGAAQAYYETFDEETEDGNWYYSIPEEGAVKWLDNICITESSERYDTALHFMNYLLEAEVGATITNFVYYATPNSAAKAFLDEGLLADEGIFPPAEVEEKLSWLIQVDDDAQLRYDELWTAVKAGG